MTNKLFSNKRRQINKNKQKNNIGETSPSKTIIRSLSSSNKKQLPVLIPAIKELLLKIQNIDIIKIGTNAYDAAYRLKKAQVFAISMKYI